LYVTIDLSEQNATVLQAQARAAHMPPESYLREIIERALQGRPMPTADGQPEGQPLKPKKSAYGLLAGYGPGPTEEEIDENRREMFSGFGEFEP
jgi:hypothetical protein